MSRRARFAAAFTSLVLLGRSPHAAEQAWKPPKVEGWIEAKSPHFTYYSSVGEDKTRKIATQLERFRLTLGRITKGLNLDEHEKTSIYVFRNDPAFTPYKLDGRGEPENIAGYFMARPYGNYVALDASAGFTPMRVVYHEYFHSVAHATLGDVPPWLDEGLAEYFSTFHTEGPSAVIQVGHPIEYHLRVLAENGKLPWNDVFDTRHSSSNYHEKNRQGKFYAQAWLLVHYLLSTDERVKQFGEYISLLRDGADPDESLVEAFGMDRKAIGIAVDAYQKKGSNFVYWDLGDEAVKPEVTIRDMTPAGVLLRLGDLLAHRGQSADARRYLEAARTAGAPVADVEIALGYADLTSRDVAGSETHLRAAVAAGAVSPEPYGLLAETLLRNASSEPMTAANVPMPVLDARGLLKTALEHDPNCVPALVLLARTYLFESDTKPGLTAAGLAQVLRPLDRDVTQLRACLLSRGGKPGAAWALVKHELARRNADDAKEAASCVEGGAVAAAASRLGAGDRDGAKAVLDDAVTAIDDAEIRERLRAMRDEIASGAAFSSSGEITSPSAGLVAQYNTVVHLLNEGKLDQAATELDAFDKACAAEPGCGDLAKGAAKLRATIVHNREVDRYNEAVRDINAGKRKEAIAILRELSTSSKDAELVGHVREVLKQLGAKP